MKKSRFEVAKASKFEKLSNADLQSVKGGAICLSCMKKAKSWELTLGDHKPSSSSRMKSN